MPVQSQPAAHEGSCSYNNHEFSHGTLTVIFVLELREISKAVDVKDRKFRLSQHFLYSIQYPLEYRGSFLSDTWLFIRNFDTNVPDLLFRIFSWSPNWDFQHGCGKKTQPKFLLYSKALKFDLAWWIFYWDPNDDLAQNQEAGIQLLTASAACVVPARSQLSGTQDFQKFTMTRKSQIWKPHRGE